MNSIEREVRTLSELGLSARGICDLTAFPIARVRAIIQTARKGGKGIRKCSSPSDDPVDRRYISGLPVLGYPGPRHAIPYVGDRVESHGPVRVIYSSGSENNDDQRRF